MLLAHQDPEWVEAYLRRTDLRKVTETTEHAATRLLDEIADNYLRFSPESDRLAFTLSSPRAPADVMAVAAAATVLRIGRRVRRCESQRGETGEDGHEQRAAPAPGEPDQGAGEGGGQPHRVRVAAKRRHGARRPVGGQVEDQGRSGEMAGPVVEVLRERLAGPALEDGLAAWDGRSEQVPCDGYAVLFGRSIAAVIPEAQRARVLALAPRAGLPVWLASQAGKIIAVLSFRLSGIGPGAGQRIEESVVLVRGADGLAGDPEPHRLAVVVHLG